MDRFDAFVSRAIKAQAAADEAVIKWLLGRWASELEPSIAREQGTGRILGLCVADDPTGAIVVPMHEVE